MAIKFSVSKEGGFDALHVEGGPCSQPPRSYVVDAVVIDGRIVVVGDGVGATIMVDTDCDSQIEEIRVYHDSDRGEFCDNIARRIHYKPEKLSRVNLDQSFTDWFRSLM